MKKKFTQLDIPCYCNSAQFFSADPMCRDNSGHTSFDLLDNNTKITDTTRENMLSILRSSSTSSRRGRRSLDFSLDNGDNELEFGSPRFNGLALIGDEGISLFELLSFL